MPASIISLPHVNSLPIAGVDDHMPSDLPQERGLEPIPMSARASERLRVIHQVLASCSANSADEQETTSETVVAAN